jgi:hypothetical protein
MHSVAKWKRTWIRGIQTVFHERLQRITAPHFLFNSIGKYNFNNSDSSKLYFFIFLSTFVRNRRSIHFQCNSPKITFNFYNPPNYFIRLESVYNFWALKTYSYKLKMIRENLYSLTGFSQILMDEDRWCSLRRIINIVNSKTYKSKELIFSNNNAGVLIQI